jgi:hypothetical protein
MIEYFTNSSFSHVENIIKDPTFTTPPLKGLYILESGIEEHPDVEDGRKKCGVQLVRLEDALAIPDCSFYYRKLHCAITTEFFNKLAQVHSEVHRDNTFWCSALASYVYYKLGLLPDSTPWTLIAPTDWSSYESEYKVQFINCTLDNEIII